MRAALVLLAGAGAAWLAVAPRPARAIPPPAEPRGRAPRSFASDAPYGSVLPYGARLEFTLEDPVNSAKNPVGSVVRLHLTRALVVNGITVAPAGSPETMTIVSTTRAGMGDSDGSVQVLLAPFELPGRPFALPVRAQHEYMTRELSGGAAATRSTTDTIGDVFIPYHQLYHVLRPGHQMVLPAGAVLFAETAATLTVASPGSIVVSTPPPITTRYDVPHADLTASPIFTPSPVQPHPHGRATIAPRPSPSASAAQPGAAPSDAASAAPSGAASAQPSPSAAASASAQPTGGTDRMPRTVFTPAVPPLSSARSR